MRTWRTHQSVLLLMLVILLPISGCVSSRSTMLYRDECNNGWLAKRKLAGIPITLKVTTHLRVAIREHHFREDTNDSEVWNQFFIKMDQPVRSVVVDPIKTDKIFTVDSRRPGAGTLTSNISFTNQYPDDITYDVDDQTIEKVTALIEKIAPQGLFGTRTTEDGEQKGRDGAPNLVEEASVVAVKLFELDSPNLEAELKEFLGTHLNNCHTCGICTN